VPAPSQAENINPNETGFVPHFNVSLEYMPIRLPPLGVDSGRSRFAQQSDAHGSKAVIYRLKLRHPTHPLPLSAQGTEVYRR
jgi:hypothetical protein